MSMWKKYNHKCCDIWKHKNHTQSYSGFQQYCSTSFSYTFSAQKTHASLLAQIVKSLPAMWETWVQSVSQEDPPSWRRKWQITSVFLPRKFHGFRKGRGTRDQIANIHWKIEKKLENSRKTSTFASLNMLKPLTVQITVNCEKSFTRW